MQSPGIRSKVNFCNEHADALSKAERQRLRQMFLDRRVIDRIGPHRRVKAQRPGKDPDRRLLRRTRDRCLLFGIETRGADDMSRATPRGIAGMEGSRRWVGEIDHDVGGFEQARRVVIDHDAEGIGAGKGTEIQLNGKSISETLPDLAFYNAILKIWLGDKPADSSLKPQLLGAKE